MNRRNMILTLGSAALIPSTRLFANFNDNHLGQPVCDRKFAQMITNLEHESWHICAVPLKPKHVRLKIADAVYSDDFFEVLGFGYLTPRSELMDTIASGLFLVDPNYQFWNDFVVRTSPTSALINYRMIVSYTWDGDPITDDIFVTSSYAQIKGRWQCCSYHETYAPPAA